MNTIMNKPQQKITLQSMSKSVVKVIEFFVRPHAYKRVSSRDKNDFITVFAFLLLTHNVDKFFAGQFAIRQRYLQQKHPSARTPQSGRSNVSNSPSDTKKIGF